MTIKHHPGDGLLLDYVTGSLGEAASLAVAVHLALCPECRRQVNLMEAVGGSLLNTFPDEALKEEVFGNVLEQINSDREILTPVRSNDVSTEAEFRIFPSPLPRYLFENGKSLQWRWIGFGINQIVISTSSDGNVARLMRIESGRSVPSHSHRGVELTLVLSGSFYDQTGSYARGDMQVVDETIDHDPRAEHGVDCICLVVTEGPLRFNSLVGKVAQPFVGI